MTTVGKTGSETKIVIMQNDGTLVSNSSNEQELRKAFTFEQGETSQPQKALKAQDLNFENVPKKNRKDAFDFANRSLNEIKDAAREFNADFPDKPYVVDYSGFPKPEEFPKKNYGGDKEAYEAWKNAVTEWVEDCKQDMVSQKSNHLGSLAEKFERTLNNGFFNIYLQMGITREFIQATFEALDGNINQVKEKLDKKAQEIMQNSRRVGNEVKNEISENLYSEAGHIHRHIERAKLDTKSDIYNAADKVIKKVGEQTAQVQSVVENEHARTRQEVKTAGQQTKEIGALSSAISAALHDDQDVERTDETLNKVEALKLEIIQSTKVDHNKKLELLNELLNLINTDGWITDGDLDKIVTEVRRII